MPTKFTDDETSVSDASGDAIYLPDRDARIAELAYFKAESRGFEPGHELEDWLEAEQEFLL
ncbi:MAG: DUF2934 domain-containing protein [Methylococcales bacterium]|nr:DUF2934 domain-containing protein [Methylococcales bacterium]